MMPTAVDPDGAGVNGLDPVAGNPDVGVPIPAMVAGDPNPARMRAGTPMLDDYGWRADLDVDALRERHAGETEECGGSQEEQSLFH
jgi:hypothetical protein